MTARSTGLARTRVTTACLLALALAFAACSGGSARTLPPPSSTSSTDPAPTTTKVDYSKVALDAVPGQTTTTLSESGSAQMSGFVSGPDGMLADAFVRIERLVGDGVHLVELRTGPDGTWSVEGLPGGRFRVRAFLQPDLTSAEAKVFYLRDGEVIEIPLIVERFVGLDIAASTSPLEPVVGDGVNLAVRVVERFVDEEGRGQTRPLPNVVVRVRSAGWTELKEPEGVTDADGVVVFEFRCDRAGGVAAVALVGDPVREFGLEVPACAPRPTTTTTDPAGSDDPAATGSG